MLKLPLVMVATTSGMELENLCITWNPKVHATPIGRLVVTIIPRNIAARNGATMNQEILTEH